MSFKGPHNFPVSHSVKEALKLLLLQAHGMKKQESKPNSGRRSTSMNRKTQLQCSFKTLSSNARRVPFEYPQIYLNKKGKVCKTRVNEWIINQI